MRSSSEIRWVRVKNAVNQSTKVSDWHAIVPGMGVNAPPPGVSCETALVGSTQFATNEEVVHRDGKRHAECQANVDRWIAGLDPTADPLPDWVDRERLAAPGEGDL